MNGEPEAVGRGDVSRVGGAVAALSRVIGRAWARSTARARLLEMGGAWQQLSGMQRVRLAGIALAAAASADAAAAPLDPRPASALRWLLWALCLAIGAAAAAGAQPLHDAWTEWRRTR